MGFHERGCPKDSCSYLAAGDAGSVYEVAGGGDIPSGGF